MKREHLIAPHERGIVQRIKRRMKRGKRKLERPLSIFLNNYCNLDCYSCAALGMITRLPPVNTSLDDIEKFLIHMEKLHPGKSIMLTGGEPTMYPFLREVCDLVHSYGFKVSMLTNGFKVFSPELFDFIILDYHGENKEKLAEWTSLLEKSEVEWDIRSKQHHQDIPFAMKDNITKGARCSNWLNPLTLWQNVVYPCCNIMCVEWWHDTFEVTMSLINSGWIVDNSNLVKCIENWRESLPSEFYRLCTIGCWKDANKALWKPT